MQVWDVFCQWCQSSTSTSAALKAKWLKLQTGFILMQLIPVYWENSSYLMFCCSFHQRLHSFNFSLHPLTKVTSYKSYSDWKWLEWKNRELLQLFGRFSVGTTSKRLLRRTWLYAAGCKEIWATDGSTAKAAFFLIFICFAIASDLTGVEKLQFQILKSLDNMENQNKLLYYFATLSSLTAFSW